jgi:poly(hydroxyalkanoate) granule-associated protein
MSGEYTMMEPVDVHEEMPLENGHNPMLEMARRMLLAGIGAVALAQEEIEEFVQKLVDRGEIAEKDGRKLVKDIMERRRRKAQEVREETEEEFDKRIEQLLVRMNIPSKTDIEALNVKITALTKKVEDLRKANV